MKIDMDLEDTVHFKQCVIEMKEDTERPDLCRMLAAFQEDPNGLPQRVIDLFKKYVTIIKETIPKYTQELGIIDYYIGSFLGYVYDPVEKVYKLSFCRRQGAGIIEISIKEGITIEN